MINKVYEAHLTSASTSSDSCVFSGLVKLSLLSLVMLAARFGLSFKKQLFVYSMSSPVSARCGWRRTISGAHELRGLAASAASALKCT